RPTGRYPYVVTITPYAGGVAGTPLTFSDQVLSNNQLHSPFGAGWSVDILDALVIRADQSVILETGVGATLFFERNSDGSYTSPTGDFSTLVRNGDGSFTRTLKDGTQYVFDPVGREVSVTDRNLNSTTFTYDSSGRLVSVVDPVG